MSQPVRVGEKIELKIKDIAYSPDGIGKVENFVVFVPYTIPEDEVKVLITEVRKNFARGKLLSVIKPSEFRVKPICRWFGECGGCHWQNVDYKKQLEFKHLLVKNALNKIKEIKVLSFLPAEDIYYYRNKAQFPVDTDKRVTGLYSLKSHYIINIDECPLVKENINKVYKEIKKLLSENNYKFTNLRNIVIRTSETNKELVVFVLKDENIESIRKLIECIRFKFPEVSILCNTNKKETNVVIGDKTIKVYGEGVLRETMENVEYEFNASSFFQTNTKQALSLCKYVRKLLNSTSSAESDLLDLYCGVGTISLFVADKFKKVTGIDEVKDVIHNAKSNAKLNVVENCEFLYGKAENILIKLIKSNFKADTVILDPPRKGCSKDVLLNLSRIGAKNIVYVSCDIATLARDLEILIKEGYEVNEVQPVDMFPNTFHIETVTGLVKNK